MPSIMDIGVTVIVPKAEYETLVRNSEKIKILERMYEKYFVSEDDVRAVLGIEKKCEGGTNNAEKL